MKGILNLMRAKTAASAPADAQASGHSGTESMLFATAFADQGVDGAMLVPWEARAVEIGAKRMTGNRGIKLLKELWSRDKYMVRLPPGAVDRMEGFFDFASVPADRDIIRQDEYGNFMIVLLFGTIAVDRVQPWGEHLRLTEAKAGDILGEMSLLDSGMRFSQCTALTDCEFAVLDADGMDRMMAQEPQLAASLIALLARKLSLRLRVVSARLSDKQN